LAISEENNKERGQGMALAYSEDLRGRALDLLESGQTQEVVSKLLKIGISTIKYGIVAQILYIKQRLSI
jgi:hypothetical protein